MKKIFKVLGIFLLNLTGVLIGLALVVTVAFLHIPTIIHFMDIPLNCPGDFIFLFCCTIIYWIIVLPAIYFVIKISVEETQKDLQLA